MGWSPAFIEALSASVVVPRWRLEFVSDLSGTQGASASSPSHEAGSSLGFGPSISVGGGRVSPGSWSYTDGSWSVSIVGSIQPLHDAGIIRGNLARLLVGFEGWDEADYEPIAIGAIDQISGVKPNYLLIFRSILTHLQTRHTNASADLSLFDSLDLDDADRTPVSTAVTAKYDPASDTTITVTSTASFEKGSTLGVLLCDDSTSGDPFLVNYTGSTATSFTGVSSSDRFGTSRVCLSTAGTVYAGAYLEGHPLDIAREILASTGNGTNGTYDTLPETWGLGVPQDWIDDDDIDVWKAAIGNKAPGGTDHDWDLAVFEGQSNAIGWLASQIAEAGIWLVVRQGRISIRAAQNPDETSVWRFEDTVRTGLHIDLSDIEEIEAFDAWHPEVPAESAGTIAVYNSGHSPPSPGAPLSSVEITDGYVNSIPGTTRAEHDLTESVWETSTDPALDVIYRCGIWEMRIPERLRLRCRGLRLAQLCPGDIVDVTCPFIEGALSHTRGGYDEVQAMVTAVDTDWIGGIVVVEVAVVSEDFGT